MNVLIASDKFKGSLTALQVCTIIQKELMSLHPQWKITTCPLADGGEGSLDCFVNATHAKSIKGTFTNANFELMETDYAILNDIAFIELAKTAGLVQTKVKNPLKTTTYGVGEQIKDALTHNVKTIYIAIGGSSTNDAGCGMAAALGYQFINFDNQVFIPTGENIDTIKTIIPPTSPINARFIILCDVANPLYGQQGAAYVYAKQKGANDEQIQILDNNLKYFNQLALKKGYDFQKIAGSGAAGGFGAGSIYFLNATLQSGAKTFFDLCNLKQKIQHSDLIISGEGKIDSQSLQGKLVHELYKLCNNKSFMAVCGCSELKQAPFTILEVNQENETLKESIHNCEKNLKKSIQNYFQKFNK